MLNYGHIVLTILKYIGGIIAVGLFLVYGLMFLKGVINKGGRL